LLVCITLGLITKHLTKSANTFSLHQTCHADTLLLLSPHCYLCCFVSPSVLPALATAVGLCLTISDRLAASLPQ
jgi:hypothetical protein